MPNPDMVLCPQGILEVGSTELELEPIGAAKEHLIKAIQEVTLHLSL